MNLVFASGVAVPQRVFGIDYFRGVRAHLEGRHALAFPPVSPFGTVEQRAGELADGIQAQFPNGDIHIIAHSMGGLDSRMLIAANHHGLTARIASLTTLSTPHRGSPVADLIVGPEPHGARRVLYEGIRSAFGVAGISTGAVANLTTQSASAVPDVIAGNPHIRFRSCFASGRQGQLRAATCVPFVLTHRYLNEQTGEPNDGMVARESARYGEFDEQGWPCDHADIIGYDLDLGLTGFHFDHLARFDEIIARL
jgi:triacylglycerol lipase